MAGTFEILGRLSIGKETDKFHPYEVTTSEKGWVSTKLMFNVLSENNRHSLISKGGHLKTGGVVYSFTKKTKDKDGNEIKGQSIQVKWEERHKQSIIDTIAEFKKFVIDLEKPKRRHQIEKALEKAQDGDIEEDTIKELGIDTTDNLVEALTKALEESKKKRKEFIAESDFTEYLYKLISSGKVDGQKFIVKGEIQHSEYNGKFYKSLVPTRIYLAEKDAEEVGYGEEVVFFNSNSLDSLSFEEKGKYYVNCFVRAYDGNRKTEIPCPIQLVIDCNGLEEESKQAKVRKLFKAQFTVEDDSWKELGVKFKMLDGAQKMEITPDMLSDTQKEMLELEMITMKELERELGIVYGDRITESSIVNVLRGYTKGRKDTLYTDDDFVIKSVELDEDVLEENTEEVEDEDIFDLDLD